MASTLTSLDKTVINLVDMKTIRTMLMNGNLTGGLGRGAIFCMVGGSMGGKAGNWLGWAGGSKVGRLGWEE